MKQESFLAAHFGHGWYCVHVCEQLFLLDKGFAVRAVPVVSSVKAVPVLVFSQLEKGGAVASSASCVNRR